ncbi:Pvc16 family protein [Oscillochloris sp. ZM17-4]|uniref:Pvc16 family protein n=1 Tax=Oscillochloris sp. ZM17-4 TaxID=2866714 RepID=UPI001C72B0AB|nr:Pvc16 family protein [Oscillochloris sp. ZM17-4]MBX0331310.1 Pvc16 family protein [Oscillochloris sp. ZM17-4]
MLATLHTTLRRMLYERGKIDPGQVDVQFARPTRAWADALTAPTINLYLYEIEENPDFRNVRPRVVKTSTTASTHMAPARIDLRYIVAAFSSNIEDEQLLIWRTLAVLLKHPALPTELLADEVRALDISLLTKITRLGEGPPSLDTWQAFEVPPRPAVLYTVTAPLDPELVIDAPLVLTGTTRFVRSSPEDEAAGIGIMRDRAIVVASSVHVGGVVRDRQGAPLTGVAVSIEGRAMDPVITSQEGRFILGSQQPGQLVLRVVRPGAESTLVSLVIPSETYDVVVD